MYMLSDTPKREYTPDDEAKARREVVKAQLRGFLNTIDFNEAENLRDVIRREELES